MGGIRLAREAFRLWAGEMLGLTDRGLAKLGLGVALSLTRSRRSTAEGGVGVVVAVAVEDAGEMDRVGSMTECRNGDDDDDDGFGDEYNLPGGGFGEKDMGRWVCEVEPVRKCVEEEALEARCSKADT